MDLQALLNMLLPQQEMPLPGGMLNPANVGPALFNMIGTGINNIQGGQGPFTRPSRLNQPSANPVGDQASRAGQNARQAQMDLNGSGAANGVRQVFGQPPQANPGQLPGQGNTLPTQGPNTGLGPAWREREQSIVGGGLENALSQAKYDRGENPAAQGINSSLAKQFGSQLGTSELARTLMGGTSAQAGQSVLGGVLGNGASMYGGDDARNMFQGIMQRAQQYTGAEGAADPMNALAWKEFMDPNNPRAVENRMNLLFGTEGGPSGEAKRGAYLNQALLGKMAYQRPQDYIMPENTDQLDWNSIYNAMRHR